LETSAAQVNDVPSSKAAAITINVLGFIEIIM
jgi:hypothetical protein